MVGLESKCNLCRFRSLTETPTVVIDVVVGTIRPSYSNLILASILAFNSVSQCLRCLYRGTKNEPKARFFGNLVHLLINSSLSMPEYVKSFDIGHRSTQIIHQLLQLNLHLLFVDT